MFCTSMLREIRFLYIFFIRVHHPNCDVFCVCDWTDLHVLSNNKCVYDTWILAQVM